MRHRRAVVQRHVHRLPLTYVDHRPRSRASECPCLVLDSGAIDTSECRMSSRTFATAPGDAAAESLDTPRAPWRLHRRSPARCRVTRTQRRLGRWMPCGSCRSSPLSPIPRQPSGPTPPRGARRRAPGTPSLSSRGRPAGSPGWSRPPTGRTASERRRPPCPFAERVCAHCRFLLRRDFHNHRRKKGSDPHRGGAADQIRDFYESHWTKRGDNRPMDGERSAKPATGPWEGAGRLDTSHLAALVGLHPTPSAGTWGS